MKIIDLLNKIANGEEVPKKIAIDSTVYVYTKQNYYEDYEGYSLFEDVSDSNIKEFLDEEVEIIEEQEEINIQNIEEIPFEDNTSDNAVLRDTRDLIINQLVKAVKQLDKRIDK